MVPVSAQVGFALIAVAASITAGWYLLELHRIRQGKVPVRRRGWRLRPLFGPGVRSPHPLTPEPDDETVDPAADPADATSDHTHRPPPPDPTLVDVDATTVRRGFAVDPPWGSRSSAAAAGADVTTVGAPPPPAPPPPPDGARRWMRRAPQSEPVPDRGADGPDAELRGQGMLFGPEAWDEGAAVDDQTATPPAGPDDGPPSG